MSLTLSSRHNSEVEADDHSALFAEGEPHNDSGAWKSWAPAGTKLQSFSFSCAIPRRSLKMPTAPSSVVFRRSRRLLQKNLDDPWHHYRAQQTVSSFFTKSCKCYRGGRRSPHRVQSMRSSHRLSVSGEIWLHKPFRSPSRATFKPARNPSQLEHARNRDEELEKINQKRRRLKQQSSTNGTLPTIYMTRC